MQGYKIIELKYHIKYMYIITVIQPQGHTQLHFINKNLTIANIRFSFKYNFLYIFQNYAPDQMILEILYPKNLTQKILKVFPNYLTFQYPPQLMILIIIGIYSLFRWISTLFCLVLNQKKTSTTLVSYLFHKLSPTKMLY